MLAQGESKLITWKAGWTLAALCVLALGITVYLRLRDPSIHLLAREARDENGLKVRFAQRAANVSFRRH